MIKILIIVIKFLFYKISYYKCIDISNNINVFELYI